MRARTVLSLEQALSLPYATLRFAQLGWRVIRIEATPAGGGLPGDPNRYIGNRAGGDGRRSYFIAPNVGKEAIALDLKTAEGRDILKRLVSALDVDIFCCNTLPARYRKLGIDYETLKGANPRLIWAGISAMGPDYPDVPGYDPALQAMAGFMDLTGDADGAPMLSGIPLIDLKAGDELFAAVMMALAERAESGAGQAIDISMLQAAASWLITAWPLIELDGAAAEIGRSGNAHRKFIPTNAYPTADGFIYIAIGNDRQWQRLTGIPGLETLARPEWQTNEGRMAGRKTLYRDIAAITSGLGRADLAVRLQAAGIPHATINSVREVAGLGALKDKRATTTAPDGRIIHMQPPATDRMAPVTDLPFAPGYGADSFAVLGEAGYDADTLRRLRDRGIIYQPPTDSDVPA